MADEVKDLLERSFGKDQPLTEEQKQNRRNSAVFALLTFNQLLGDNDFKEMHVVLTPEQIGFAESFSEVFPSAIANLPGSELNSAKKGFMDFITTISDLLPALLTGKKLEFDGDAIVNWIPLSRKKYLDTEYEIASRLFEEDPSTVSYAQHLLNRFEDKATENKNIELEGKKDEFRAKKAAILAKARDIPNETDPDLYKQQLKDVISGKRSFVNTNQTPREVFIHDNYVRLNKEIPLEADEHGKLIPSDGLRLVGARLAFQHYQTAVNTYLKRWGDQGSI